MFTEEDVRKADQFAKTLTKAKFEMTVPEWLAFHQQLVWYNEMIKKVSAHVLEITKVSAPPEPEPKKKSK